MLGDAVLAFQQKTFEVALEDEVHDARDRVRTVKRRSAAGQDVDALDELRRDVFKSTIGEPARPPTTRRLLISTSVRLEPRSRRSMVAMPAPEVRNAELVVLSAGVPNAGFSGQNFLDVDRTRLVDVLLADHLDRSERGDVRRHDARTGDDDRLGRAVLRVLAVRAGVSGGILLPRRRSGAVGAALSSGCACGFAGGVGVRGLGKSQGWRTRRPKATWLQSVGS